MALLNAVRRAATSSSSSTNFLNPGSLYQRAAVAPVTRDLFRSNVPIVEDKCNTYNTTFGSFARSNPFPVRRDLVRDEPTKNVPDTVLSKLGAQLNRTDPHPLGIFKNVQLIGNFSNKNGIISRYYSTANPSQELQAKKKGDSPRHRGQPSTATASTLPIPIISHINKGIEEIMADYVHQEMSRSAILVLVRLLLLIAAKDLFIYFAF